MNTEHTINTAEIEARRLLGESFGKVFNKVAVLTNLIFPTGPGSAVKSTEMDAVVVCNAGVFVFEIKGWHNCEVHREKKSSGESQWSLLDRNNGFRKAVNDPLQQIGGKLKVLSPLVQDALLTHLAQHTTEIAQVVNALSADQLGERVTQSIGDVVSKIKQPIIRSRSYVFLPMSGVEIGMNIPPSVLTRQELPYLVRHLAHECSRKGNVCAVFSDSMVEPVAQTLEAAGKVITHNEHLSNVHAVHGGCEKALGLEVA